MVSVVVDVVSEDDVMVWMRGLTRESMMVLGSPLPAMYVPQQRTKIPASIKLVLTKPLVMTS